MEMVNNNIKSLGELSTPQTLYTEETLDNIRALGEKIIFQFMDDANEKGFTNKTSWGLEVKTHDDNAKNPRWVKVIKTGPRVPDHVTIGSYVLVEPLMWTMSYKIGGEKFWATDYAKVIGALPEKPHGIY
jgi:hypothetical protein